MKYNTEQDIERILITNSNGVWLVHINAKSISPKGKGKWKLVYRENEKDE